MKFVEELVKLFGVHVLLVAAVAVVVLGAVIALAAHYTAKPGTEVVTLFGLLKYTKRNQHDNLAPVPSEVGSAGRGDSEAANVRGTLARGTRYDSNILNDGIFARIAANAAANDTRFERTTFRARVDPGGNYYACYTREGPNTASSPLHDVLVITSADAVHEFERMRFAAFDTQNRLDVRLDQDHRQRKAARIYLDEAVSPGCRFWIEYLFQWKATMAISTGDTDHFWVGDTSLVFVELNFRAVLRAPSLFLVKGNQVIDEAELTTRHEADGSVTYEAQVKNTGFDGVIFYFEGVSRTLTRWNTSIEKTVLVSDSHGEEFHLGSAKETEIRDVYGIECRIEGTSAATEATLHERLNTFRDGFVVARDRESQVVGYIETIIWKRRAFESFEDIREFPLHYDVAGDSMYVIFLAVDPKFRERYLGRALVDEACRRALSYGLKRVELVSRAGLVDYYRKLNFVPTRKLPRFLPDDPGNVLMERTLMSSDVASRSG